MSEQIYLCVSDLLNQDLSSFEYFQTLGRELQREVLDSDVRSFREMQELVDQSKHR